MSIGVGMKAYQKQHVSALTAIISLLALWQIEQV